MNYLKKDYTIEFISEIVRAASKEEAIAIGKRLIREGKVTVDEDNTEETDYDCLMPSKEATAENR